MDSTDSGGIVFVEFPVLLDGALHRPINKPSIICWKFSPVFFVLAPTRRSGSVCKRGGVHIADVSAVAPALPEVLLVLGIGVFKDSQPAESLPGEVLPPKPSAPAGFDVSGMELVGVDLDDLPADASALVDLRGVILPTRVLDDRQITVLPSDFAVHQTYIVASKKR